MPDDRSAIEKIIRDAMRAGEFANLPGAGKPLHLDDDPNVPDHLRMAHKLLRDNDLAPAWIMEGQELDALRERAIADLRRAARVYKAQPGAERAWQDARQRFLTVSGAYNRKVLSYNLKVPPGVAHKLHIDTAREIQRALDSV